MVVYIGSNELQKAYLGSTEIKQIWVGNNLVYGSKLPTAYQEVEYIQSSGTQYFKLGSQFKTSYKLIIDLQLLVIGSDYIPIGIRNDSGYRYGIDAWNGYYTAISGGSDWTNLKVEDKNRHKIIINKNIATFDGTNYNISYINYTFNDGIAVFGYNRGSEISHRASQKLYKLEIYNENGVLIYDLYPCYRISDNVVGMYDLVNNTFYTNSGSGSFTKGPNV